MNYKGVIIEESLTDNSIIKELNVIQKEVSKTTAREKTPWLNKWSLYTVEIEEKEIDKYAERLSKLIDNEHCSDWYCDFRNNTYHYVIFKDKFFKLNRGNKKDYKEMREYAINLGLPEYQLPTYNDLPTNLLIGFLVEAKKQTYANGNVNKKISSRLGSNDYHYEEEVEGEIMMYHDTYFGGLKFIGEEVVYRGNDKPKWGMNYYGITINENLSEEAMDKVLRPALMKVGEDDKVVPVRGPSEYKNGEYIYTFTSKGSIESFNGVERIYKNDELLYELNCNGGLIE